MTHEERVELAREIARRIVEKYGPAIQAVAIYGSTAKGEDRDHSDLEMWVATTGEPHHDINVAYRGMPVEIAYVPGDDLLRAARRVDQNWPIEADAQRSYVVLYEQGDFVRRLSEAAAAAAGEDFAEAARQRMVRLTETVGKLRNAYELGDTYGVLAGGRLLVTSAAMLLGLLNRQYYPSARGLYERSKAMPLRPDNYAALLDQAGGFTTHDSGEVYAASRQLWGGLQALARAQGVEWDTGEIEV